MTINEAKNKVISLAKDEEGYLEKKTKDNLDSKTANAGYNNYTKYWRDLADWGLGNYQGSYWCAALIHWLFVKAFGLAKAKELLLHAPYISCETLATKAVNAGRRYTSPQVGDVVIYWNGSRYYHTGYVIDVTSTTYTTIEGNTSGGSGVDANGGGVFRKQYTIASAKSKGHRFFRPDYSLVKNISAGTSGSTSGGTVSTTNNSKSNNVSQGQKWFNANYGNLLKEKKGALLTVDGQYGVASRAGTLCVFKDVLNRKHGQKLDPSNANFGSDTKKVAEKALIKINASGTFVYCAEFILSAKGHYKGDMDAAFGSQLFAATKEFQKEIGITQDGEIGKETWYHLFN